MAPLRNLFGRRSRPEEKKAEHFDECPFLPDEMLLEVNESHTKSMHFSDSLLFLTQIFQHVPPQDLGTCRRVCLRWRDVIDLEVLDSERVRQRRAKKCERCKANSDYSLFVLVIYVHRCQGN